jgi:quinate/shikimate dehydrogenase (NAD+)
MSKKGDRGDVSIATSGQSVSMKSLQLGLIGDNIAQSRAPLLHRLAGELAGVTVDYRRLVPRDLGTTFDETFSRAADGGYRGINITYPYKERAALKVEIDDPLVQAMGAVNTVIFASAGAKGYNTDYSGFVAAYRSRRGDTPAGRVCLIGAGGVGRAVAFGLLNLGLESLVLVDLDSAKAEDLATRLRLAAPGCDISVAAEAAAAAAGADGIVNCTQLGMVGYEGTPLPREALRGAAWAFDAIYTPLVTRFLGDAEAEGLSVIGGYELFFHQGIDAWRIFADRPIEPAALRRALADAGAGPAG